MNAHLIDDVARRMTDIAPPPALRARVIARLADRPAPWRTWMPALVAAAVVAVVAGLSVAQRVPREHRTPTTPGSTQTNVLETSRAPVELAIVTAAPIRQSRSRKPEAISAAEAAWRARAIPAIAAAQALAVEDIQPESLSLPLLELKPLVTTPVIVAPIAAADASGGR